MSVKQGFGAWIGQSVTKDPILSADPSKGPGREKWAASFVTRSGWGDTIFLHTAPATWGNATSLFEKQDFGFHREWNDTKFHRRRPASWENTKPVPESQGFGAWIGGSE